MSYRLNKYVNFFQLNKRKKGTLDNEMTLIDLDCVVPTLMRTNGNVKTVDFIESEKVVFDNADIILPKLRTYLGKALPFPPHDAIGSSEWIGASCTNKTMINQIAAFLNSDAMCEVYRCLQSGKQHPRIDYKELNDLTISHDLTKINTKKLNDDQKTVENLLCEKSIKRSHIYNIIRKSACGKFIPLSDFFSCVNLEKIKKGNLESERTVIDLQAVSSVSEIDYNEIEITNFINSDKVSLNGADIFFSKLEAYLGKVLICTLPDAIGSQEWVGIKCANSIDAIIGAYILTLPELKKTYRMLQSGKRHARVNVNELLMIKVDIDVLSIDKDEIIQAHREIQDMQNAINSAICKIKQFDYFLE